MAAQGRKENILMPDAELDERCTVGIVGAELGVRERATVRGDAKHVEQLACLPGHEGLQQDARDPERFGRVVGDGHEALRVALSI